MKSKSIKIPKVTEVSADEKRHFYVMKLETEKGLYDVLMHKENGVAIVAIDKNRKTVVLVEQYRQASREVEFEVPAGKMNRGETQLAAAKREFKEETGYELLNAEQVHSYYLASAYSNEKIFVFFGEYDSTQTSEQDLDDDEDVIVHHVSFSDFFNMKATGAIFLTCQYFLKEKIRFVY